MKAQSEVGKKIFTGQQIIGEQINGHQISDTYVACFKCNGQIGLRTTAWFDEYIPRTKTGKYVHRKCLSAKRQAEIREIDTADKKLSFLFIITHKLASLGWILSDGVNENVIASKSWQTATGVKVAHAYFSGSDGFNFGLHGDYTSQGNNVLSTSGVLIPQEASSMECAALVEMFAANVDRHVDASYARKLYLNYGMAA